MNGSQNGKKINFDEVHELAQKLAKEPPFTPENLYVDLLLTLAAEKIQAKFEFVLKGGTAILKAWSEPYRFSYDLDFSAYPGAGDPRKHYKSFKNELEKFMDELGFNIVEETVKDGDKSSGKHLEGGRIFKLKLMDKSKYLRQPIKLSVSSIDPETCHPTVKRKFKTIVDIPIEQYGLLYPSIIPKIQDTEVTVLSLEDICAEKIRALATRGSTDDWRFMLRDAVDLYMMEKNGFLDKVLSKDRACIKLKFSAIKNRSYWKKLEKFMSHGEKIKIRDEDLTIFFHKDVIDEEKANHIVQKIRENLQGICKEVSEEKETAPQTVSCGKRQPLKTDFFEPLRHIVRKLGFRV